MRPPREPIPHTQHSGQRQTSFPYTISPPLHDPDTLDTISCSAAANRHRSRQIAPAGGAGLQRALLQQLPPSETDKLAALAGILGVHGDQLDALLPWVSWGKHEQNGAYTLRQLDDDRGRELHLDGIGTVTEFPAALIEDRHDDSPLALAARRVHALMTDVAAPRAQALTLGAAQPVCIDEELFHLQVKSIDAHRAHVVLDNGQMLQLVWQAEHRRYVPAADLSPPPASGTGSADFRLDDFGLDDLLTMPLFGLTPEEAASIMPQPEGEAGPSRLDKGKRPASDSPPEDASRSKRARVEAVLEIDAGAEARWDAYRNNQVAELPDFADLEPAKRLLLQAAAISVPSRVEYEQRDWQARRAGRPLPARAIIQAHREACFARHAARISGVSSYRQIKLDKDVQALWNSMPRENRTFAALFTVLQAHKPKNERVSSTKLHTFDTYIRQAGVSDIPEDFAAFAKEAQKYEKTLSGKTRGSKRNALMRLRSLCYPDFPFQKRIAELMAMPGSAFQTVQKPEYLTMAANFEEFLASEGYAPNMVPVDVEGLSAFLRARQKWYEASGEARNNSRCLNLWREVAHPLYLDSRLDAAIAAHPGTSTTKDQWKKYARRLAEYAWHHQMPADEYSRWLRTLDPNGQELKAVSRWTGINENGLPQLIRQFQTHSDAPGAGGS